MYHHITGDVLADQAMYTVGIHHFATMTRDMTTNLWSWPQYKSDVDSLIIKSKSTCCYRQRQEQVATVRCTCSQRLAHWNGEVWLYSAAVDSSRRPDLFYADCLEADWPVGTGQYTAVQWFSNDSPARRTTVHNHQGSRSVTEEYSPLKPKRQVVQTELLSWHQDHRTWWDGLPDASVSWTKCYWCSTLMTIKHSNDNC